MSTVVIIGAGLAGLTSARALQERGWQVTVVDAKTGPALGTSFANAGMLTPSMADPWNAPGLLSYLIKSIGHEDSSFLLRVGALPGMLSWCLRFLLHGRRDDYAAACEANFELARYSLQQLQQWQEALGLDFEQRQNGTLKVFRDTAALNTATELAESLLPLGLAFNPMTAEAAAIHEPALAPISDKLTGALWYPQDGSGNARMFCEQLEQQLKLDGAQLLYGQPLKRWLWKKGQVAGFATAEQDYCADAIVMAAGAGSAPLLAPLGLDLMVRPVKGYSLGFDGQQVKNLPAMPVIDDALHCAITPLGNELRVAGTAELAGYNLSKPAARLANLRNMLRAMLPNQAEALLSGELASWAGLRPMSADGMPYIGPVEKGATLQKLYLNTGHGHLGWTHCAGSAQLLAAQIDGEAPALSPLPYRATRVLTRA